MADATIVPVGMGELTLIADLYNQVMSPARDESFFKRRFQGRYNVNLMVAMVEKRHAGFIVGFELMPSTYFTWLVGVLPDFRRAGIGTQLSQAQSAWAREHQYGILRFECLNQHRPMLHLAISEGFDIIGIRWDTATGNNVVIFEKDLR
ncbi:MAG: GNAT family N-acetyltransferase [Phycisphaerae bacterium]|nr:GNAT family N-acetyltransferase [Phycisphaerae bacterium]